MILFFGMDRLFLGSEGYLSVHAASPIMLYRRARLTTLSSGDPYDFGLFGDSSRQSATELVCNIQIPFFFFVLFWCDNEFALFNFSFTRGWQRY